jgi:hypothetical protein
MAFVEIDIRLDSLEQASPNLRISNDVEMQFCDCRKGGLMLFSFAYRSRKIGKTELPDTGIFTEEKTVGARHLPLSIE